MMSYLTPNPNSVPVPHHHDNTYPVRECLISSHKVRLFDFFLFMDLIHIHILFMCDPDFLMSEI